MLRSQTVLTLSIAVAWVGLTVLGWLGQGFAGLFLGLGILVAYLVQGLSRDGRVTRRLWLFPILPWAALWAVSFAFAQIHAEAFAGRHPDFTVLGFHPSFAWIVFGYWLGGVLTLTVGFVLRRDDWLSAERWDEFRRRVNPPPDDEPRP